MSECTPVESVRFISDELAYVEAGRDFPDGMRPYDAAVTGRIRLLVDERRLFVGDVAPATFDVSETVAAMYRLLEDLESTETVRSMPFCCVCGTRACAYIRWRLDRLESEARSASNAGSAELRSADSRVAKDPKSPSDRASGSKTREQTAESFETASPSRDDGSRFAASEPPRDDGETASAPAASDERVRLTIETLAGDPIGAHRYDLSLPRLRTAVADLAADVVETIEAAERTDTHAGTIDDFRDRARRLRGRGDVADENSSTGGF